MPDSLYNLTVHTKHNVMPHTEIAHTIKQTNKRLMPTPQWALQSHDYLKTNIIHLKERVRFGVMALLSRTYHKNLQKTMTMLPTWIQRIVYVLCFITYTNGFIWLNDMQLEHYLNFTTGVHSSL